MIKVLIVDDEPFIRQGLKILIDWESYDCKVVDEASNGKEAIHILQSKEIDLIITDIKMPEMNGLEFIGYVREQISEHIRFIILSGYYEFNYAKQAIKYKATDYILKPIQKEDLINILVRVRKDLEIYKQEEKAKQIQNRIIYDRNLMNLIYGNYEQSHLEYVKRYIIGSKEMCYISFEMDETDKSFHTLTLEEKVSIHQAYFNELLKVLKEYSYNIIHGVGKSEGLFDIGVVFLKEFADRQETNDRDYITALYEQLKGVSPYVLNVFIGHYVDGIEKISDSYRSIAVARSFHSFSDKKQHIAYCDEVAYKKANQFGIGKKLIEELIIHVKNNDIMLIEESVDKIYKELQEKLIEPKLIQANIYYMLYCLIDLAKELDNEADQQEILRYLQEEAFDKLAVGGSAVYFKRFAVEYSTYLEQLRINASKGGLLLKIERHIAEHYMENLSLKTLGDKFYINSVYLGQLFKKEYRMPFKDYLNHFRIQKAVEMLESTEERIYTIAAKVGYNNPDYFISKFVQLKGITPHRYRMESKKHKKLNIF